MVVGERQDTWLESSLDDRTIVQASKKQHGDLGWLKQKVLFVYGEFLYSIVP